MLTFATRGQVDWDNPSKEKVDITKLSKVAVVDSLDGTLNWSTRGRSNDYSITVTLMEFGVAVATMIYFPHEKTLYVAELGRGAWKKLMKADCETEYKQLHTSTIVEPNKSVVIVDHGKVNRNKIFPIEELLGQDGVGPIALPDLVCASAAYRALAEGGTHGFMCFTVAPEDRFPALLVTEAGGVITTLDGKGDWSWNGDRSVFAAANQQLHDNLAVLCRIKAPATMN